MPIIIPGHRPGVFGERPPWGSIDDHDLAAVRVGPGPKVDVVEMLSVTVVEEHAAIAVIPRIKGTFDLKRDDGIGQVDVFHEGNVMGAANLGLVITLPAIEPPDGPIAIAGERPGLRVGRLPAADTLCKRLFKNQRQCRLGTATGTTRNELLHTNQDEDRNRQPGLFHQFTRYSSKLNGSNTLFQTLRIPPAATRCDQLLTPSHFRNLPDFRESSLHQETSHRR